MLLIITRSHDPATDVVIASLQERGAPYTRINTDSQIERTARTIRIENGTTSRLYSKNDSYSALLNDVTTVWNRRHESPVYPIGMTNEDRSFSQHEHKQFILGLWLMLQDRFWVNSYQATTAAEVKPFQLEVARSVGLRIPKTLMTNDPAEALTFFDQCGGEVVYKTFRQAHRTDPDGTIYGIYTSPVRRETLLHKQEAIRLTPCIFQETIPKVLDLRVTIMRDHCFAMAIDTSRSSRSGLDWRRSSPVGRRYTPYELSPTMISLLHSFMTRLGLVFGCIDMAVTSAGELVFFEVNSMGEWLWLDRYVSTRMLPCFIDLLTQDASLISPRRPATRTATESQSNEETT